MPPADDSEETEAHLSGERSDAESVLRERRAHVRICAWCDAVCVEGSWYPKTELLTYAWRLDRRASHTICPDCFEEIVPGAAYPQP